MSLGCINTDQSAVFSFSSNALHIPSSKSQEIGRHARRSFKLPNACRFPVFNVDFRHIRQGKFAFYLVKFQSQIKSPFSFWFIHTWKGFAGKMALKLSRNNFFFHSIHSIVRWVNPRHIVRNLTCIGQGYFHRACGC